MREIKAYIKPHKLSDVTLALHQVKGLTGVSIVDVKGFGRSSEPAEESVRAKTEVIGDFVSHVKIEIMCPDEIVEEIVMTIQKTAHTGLRGDGKIYVSEIKTAVRISTGEHGQEAI